MNISEFQFRFLDIAEQIECTSKHSPLNLKETLNYWNILLSHLLELKDEETKLVENITGFGAVASITLNRRKKPFISKNTTQTLTAWLSIEITLCSKKPFGVREVSGEKQRIAFALADKSKRTAGAYQFTLV